MFHPQATGSPPFMPAMRDRCAAASACGSPGPNSPARVPLVRHSGEPSFSWYVGGLRYVLVTSDMQKARFSLIAKVAREATLTRWDPNETVRTVLGLSAGMSQPCKN